MQIIILEGIIGSVLQGRYIIVLTGASGQLWNRRSITLLLHVWLAIESEADLRACELRAPDTNLIPSRTQYGATQGKAERRKSLRYAGFAFLCTPLHPLTDHS